MVEPDIPNGLSFRSRLHESRTTAGLKTGTETGKQKFWRANKEKWDHVHLEARLKLRKSSRLSYSEPPFTVEAYHSIGSHIIISK